MNVGVGKYIYAALSTISRSISVHPVVNQTDTPTPSTPFIVYQRTEFTLVYSKDLWTGEITHDYSVTIVDNDYTNCLNQVDTVINTMLALSNVQKDDMNFKQVRLTGGSEDFIDGLYTQTLEFEINTMRK